MSFASLAADVTAEEPGGCDAWEEEVGAGGCWVVEDGGGGSQCLL